MESYNEYDISEAQIRIIKHIFDYRGVTAEHLLYLLYPENFSFGSLAKWKEAQKEKNKKEGKKAKQPPDLLNIRKELAKLDKLGLIEKGSLSGQGGKDSRAIYYLSRSGLEVAIEIFKIDFGHIGCGFNGDRGFFSYEQYKPPIARAWHHFMLNEFFIKLRELKMQYPSLEIDYRDNRYAAERYTIPGDDKSKTAVFRPDGEIIINGKHYFIENDRGTERTGELNSKFRGYDQYFRYLIENNRPLPEGIIWIARKSPTSLKNRYSETLIAYFNQANQWTSKVNLILGAPDDIKRIVLQEYLREDRLFDDLNKKMDTYFERPEYKGTELKGYPVEYNEEEWKTFQAIVSITQVTYEHHAFVYEQMNGFETRSIARLLEFKRALPSYKTLAQVSMITPILYCFDTEPFELYFDGLDVTHELKELFDTFFWVQITNDMPIWYIWHDGKSKRITRNPLLYKTPAKV